MNLGVTSLAAPNAASSRTARYSSTARPAASGGGRQPRGTFDAGAVAGVGLDQTGVDGKALAADQTLVDAALQHGLEQPAQQVAVAEAAVPVLREGRMIGHLAVEAEPTEPAIGEVQMDLLAQPPLRADAEAVAHDQHPDQQLRIDRRPPGLAVEWRQVCSNPVEVHETVDCPE